MAHCLPRVAIAVLLATPAVAHGWGVLPQPSPPLEERPLKLPTVRSGAPCPTTTGRRDVVPHEPYIFGSELPWFGSGPVFVALAWQDPRSGENQAVFSLEHVPGVEHVFVAKTPWVSNPSYSGPIVIRGHSLIEEDKVLEFDASGAGRRPSLHLMAPNTSKAGVWSFWPSSMWVPGPGCYGVQLDTSAGTDLVVFQAT